MEREGYIEKGVSLQIDSISPGNEFNTQTYLRAPDKVYGGNIADVAGRNAQPRSRDADSTELDFVKREKGLLLPEYRLPTEAEWEYAALGLSELREYNSYRGKKKYPWSGDSTRSTKRRTEGDQLANFKQGKGDYSGVAGWSSDNADITAPVRAFPANSFGLYGMGGNVAEWVADVYRPIINSDVSDMSYYRGNLYTKPAIGEDGKTVVVNEIEVDTTPNNKLNVKALPGEVEFTQIDESDSQFRPNFNRAYNPNYLDGDEKSTPNPSFMLLGTLAWADFCLALPYARFDLYAWPQIQVYKRVCLLFCNENHDFQYWPHQLHKYHIGCTTHTSRDRWGSVKYVRH